VERLDSIGFTWVVKARTSAVATWDEQLEALRSYKEANDNADPPRKFQQTLPDGRLVNLGKWCDTQRWHKKQNKLSEDRIRKLEV